MSPIRPLCIAVAALATAALATGPASAQTPPQLDGYRDHRGLTQAVHAIADAHDEARLDLIGSSREGRGLYILTLSRDLATAAERPALLIVAGLDGRHLVSTETAVRVASIILTEHADLLDTYTIYVIPRVNPDGTELNFAAPLAGYNGTTTPVDMDRDGLVDEDGPVDLNGDGLITMMRRPNPPLDDEATHLADPAAPRLLKKPDAGAGERAMYSVYVEGLDQDGDGRIAEDGPGTVDPDRNFMHAWPEHAPNAGAYQLSESESLALVNFVLAHPGIVAAITYGRHDNLVKVPSGTGKDVTGRGPKDLDSADVAYYKEIAKRYKELTGQERAPTEDIDGSFHAWLYAQRGIPSFATVVWGRPDPPKPEAAEDADDEPAAEADEPAADAGGDDAETPPDPVTGTWSGSVNLPEMGTELHFTFDLERHDDDTVTGTFASLMFTGGVSGRYEPGSGQLTLTTEGGAETSASFTLTIAGDALSGMANSPQGDAIEITAKRESGGESGGGDATSDSEDGKPADAEAAAWLTYSDEARDGAGFVDWQPFDHPTLGPVELGGFVPMFQTNPPAPELDDLATKQAAFVVDLLDRVPRLSVQGPTVKRLAPGLYDVRFGLVNEGYLPTATAMARKARSVPPTVVRLSVPLEVIVSGERVSRTWGIDGSGGRFDEHWILRIDDGAAVTIDVTSRQFGDRRIEFRAEPTESD